MIAMAEPERGDVGVTVLGAPSRQPLRRLSGG
jgi:hypothetical protein